MRNLARAAGVAPGVILTVGLLLGAAFLGDAVAVTLVAAGFLTAVFAGASKTQVTQMLFHHGFTNIT